MYKVDNCLGSIEVCFFHINDTIILFVNCSFEIGLISQASELIFSSICTIQ